MKLPLTLLPAINTLLAPSYAIASSQDKVKHMRNPNSTLFCYSVYVVVPDTVTQAAQSKLAADFAVWNIRCFDSPQSLVSTREARRAPCAEPETSIPQSNM